MVAETNKKLWTHEVNQKTKWFTAPSIADGVAYFVRFDSTLSAIDIETGQVEWTFDADGILSRAPAVKDDVVVFTTVDSHVYALDAISWNVLWLNDKSDRAVELTGPAGGVSPAGKA